MRHEGGWRAEISPTPLEETWGTWKDLPTLMPDEKRKLEELLKEDIGYRLETLTATFANIWSRIKFHVKQIANCFAFD
jgi:hypothetical protein